MTNPLRPTKWGNSLVHIAPDCDYWQWKQGAFKTLCGVWVPDPMDSGHNLHEMPYATCSKCITRRQKISELVTARIRLGFRSYQAFAAALNEPEDIVAGWENGNLPIPDWLPKYFQIATARREHETP